MGLPRFARNDKWRLCGHCEERSDEAISTSFLALTGFIFWGATLKHVSPVKLALMLLCMLLAPFIINRIIIKIDFLKDMHLPLENSLLPLKIILIYSLYVCFFICIGILFFLVITVVIEKPLLCNLATVISIFACSWIAGFITPGASAGFGVREAVIIQMLSKYTGEPESVSIAILFRVVTIIGDLLFFGLSFCFGNNKFNEQTNKVRIRQS